MRIVFLTINQTKQIKKYTVQKQYIFYIHWINTALYWLFSASCWELPAGTVIVVLFSPFAAAHRHKMWSWRHWSHRRVSPGYSVNGSQLIFFIWICIYIVKKRHLNNKMNIGLEGGKRTVSQLPLFKNNTENVLLLSYNTNWKRNSMTFQRSTEVYRHLHTAGYLSWWCSCNELAPMFSPLLKADDSCSEFSPSRPKSSLIISLMLLQSRKHTLYFVNHGQVKHHTLVPPDLTANSDKQICAADKVYNRLTSLAVHLWASYCPDQTNFQVRFKVQKVYSFCGAACHGPVVVCGPVVGEHRIMEYYFGAFSLIKHLVNYM